MSTNCIKETFFSDLDQVASLFEDENPVEAETMVQAIQECQKSSSANPISSVEHLSQTLKDKCSHIYKTIEPLIREELSRLGNESSVSRKRMVEETPGSLTTEECQEYAQKKLKTQDAAQPTVQNKGEKKREIKNITDIMAQLQTDHYQGISLLQPFVPGFTPPPPGYSIPSDIDSAIEEQKSLLTAALKACRCALNVLPRSLATRIIQNKSELARLLDVSHIRKVGAMPHPETNVLLPLTEALASRWQTPHNEPLLEVPGYLFLYPHAVDSKEGKNALTTNGARYFNTLNPWTTTLKYVEANVLKRPLSTYSAQELQDLLISLHNLLQGEKQPFRSQEMLVSPTAEEDPFGEYIKYHETTEPETCQRLREAMELAARWGSFERGGAYYTEQHWTAEKQLGYVAPAPGRIVPLLNQFLERLIPLLKSTTYHPYQIASFIHFGITGIHLFGDGNGRLSRLFANIYLMQQGFFPFFIFNDEEYTDIVLSSPEEFQQKFGDLIDSSIRVIHKLIEKKNLPMEKHETMWREMPGCPIM